MLNSLILKSRGLKLPSNNKIVLGISGSEISRREKSTGSSSKLVKLAVKDGVSKTDQLVYRVGIENYVQTTKYVGFVSSISAVASLPVILLSDNQIVRSSMIGTLPLSSSGEMIGCWFFLVAHAIFSGLACYKVPLRIYFNDEEEKFKIVINHYLPWVTKVLTIEPGGIEPKLKENDFFQMNRFRHIVVRNSRSLYISPVHFKSGFFYQKLLGTNHSDDSNC